MSLQLALNVVFFVLVAALARATTWDNLIAAAQEKVLLRILATTVPIDERPKRRRRQKHLDAWVFMASQGFVRIVDLVREHGMEEGCLIR